MLKTLPNPQKAMSDSSRIGNLEGDGPNTDALNLFCTKIPEKWPSLDEDLRSTFSSITQRLPV